MPITDHSCNGPSLSPCQACRNEQRISFAYGNVSMHNPDVTREMVEEQASKLGTDSPMDYPSEETVTLYRSELPIEVVQAVSNAYTAKVMRLTGIEFGVCLRGAEKDEKGRCIHSAHSICWPLPKTGII